MKRLRMPQRQLHLQIINNTQWFLNILLLLALISSCQNSTKQASDDHNNTNMTNYDTSRENKPQIGYSDINIFLGDKKRKIDSFFLLKSDIYSNDGKFKGEFYSELGKIKLDKLNGNLSLGFFFKEDSTLDRFWAGLVFDNYDRDKIIGMVREELKSRFTYVGNFSTLNIKEGIEQIDKYNGYEIKFKFDTSTYAPAFYYEIKLIK
jgi:hypothetical protein